MKQPIRYFSIGLLTASIILLFIFTIFTDKDKAAEVLSIDEMITIVQEDGYRVLSESDYISLAVNGGQTEDDKENSKDKEKKEADTKQENKDQQEAESEDKIDEEIEKEEVITYTLHVKENMLGPNISKLLVENKIIDDADKFSKFLEDEGYSKYIQLGKHKVTSEMSSKELAEEITKY